MASTFKTLVQDTAVYGLSSMVGRFLNWMLTFVYVQVLLKEEMGQMTNLYAWTAVLLIILTYGMETSFFRFASKADRPNEVFGTTLYSLGFTSILFVVVGGIFSSDIARFLGQGEHTELVWLLVGIIALEAFTAIPMGYLRYQRRPWWFMTIRMTFVLLTIALTLGVFFVFPLLEKISPAMFGGIYRPELHLHYVLGINLIGNILQLMMLLPTIAQAKRVLDVKLLREMLSYGWPILLLGLVGTVTNQADKIIFPAMFADRVEGDRLLGIYSACYKLAVIMVLFTQAFRYAYDPFVFAKSKESDESARQAYADGMKYYIITSLVIMVGVMAYLDLVKLLIPESYYSGLVVVPYIMFGQLMFGIYSNLSIWFKLTDQTHWGAIISSLGCVLTVGLIYILTPYISFMACAYASVIANAVMMIISFLLGRKHYRVPYALGRIGIYAGGALGALAVLCLVRTYVADVLWIRLSLGTLVLILFISIIAYKEVSLDSARAILHKVRNKLH